MDTVTVRSGRRRSIIRKNYKEQISLLQENERKEPNIWVAEKQYSNGNPRKARACVNCEVTGKDIATVEALCLKLYWGNPTVRILEGRLETCPMQSFQLDV